MNCQGCLMIGVMLATLTSITQCCLRTTLAPVVKYMYTITTRVDGGWSPWSDWSDCSVSCGHGTLYRERTCTNPSPTLRGLPCQGQAREHSVCLTPCNTSEPTPNIVEVCEMAITDIAFLIDTSGSIEIEEWQQQIEFVHTVVEGFNIGPNAIQVAAVTFSFTITKEFFLNEHTTKLEVLGAIDRIPKREGFTYTSEGLRFVRRNIFTAANGDRSNATNVLIVVTDGKSSSGYNPTMEASLLKGMGVIIIAIGVGEDSDIAELGAMASSPSHMIDVTDFASLQAIQNEVQTRACEDLVFVSRAEWRARTTTLFTMPTPVSLVLIHHTIDDQCTTKKACVARVRSIQAGHMDDEHFDDIGYSFLLGDDDRVYVGRGWDNYGAHAIGYNTSVGIALIGNFETKEPTESMMTNLRKLLYYGVKHGHLTIDYQVGAHRDVAATDCPGQHVYNIIKEWTRFTNNP